MSEHDRLFDADEYGTRATRHRSRTECCALWDRFDRKDEALPWATVHKLAHSRVPFTDEYLAHLTGLEQEVAGALALAACDEGWLQPAVTEADLRPEQGAMWVGRLTADRY